MLGVAHLGYTVGAAWLVEKLRSDERRLDYRGVAAAAIAADVIDRGLFVFVLTRASSGRHIAHTLGFQLAMGLGLTALRRSWWPYAAASASTWHSTLLECHGGGCGTCSGRSEVPISSTSTSRVTSCAEMLHASAGYGVASNKGRHRIDTPPDPLWPWS